MCNYTEFDALLSRYFDGEASADDLARLELGLAADERLAEYASQWCLLHRQIVEMLHEDALHHLMDQYAAGSPGLPKNVFSPLSASSARREMSNPASYDASGSHRRRRLFGISAAVAAALVIGATVHWQLGSGGSSSDQASRSDARPAAASPGEATIVATITRLENAVWKPDAKPLGNGQQLPIGSRVALLSGMVKVTYECGAEVVLEGPCEFLINGKMVGILNSGRITADVPRRAFAFAILAPGVDFVDLGTSFGLNVNESGGSELHVFDGEVLCNQTEAAVGPENLIHVTADNALGFQTGVDRASAIDVNKEQFSKLIALRNGAAVAPQSWTGDELALWLAADASMPTDEQRGVVAWRDILFADNRSAEDAMQAQPEARPRLVKDALNGRPAVRFDGDSDFLLTTPMQTTDDQTVLLVGQFSPRAFEKERRWGGQIINYDGLPNRYLSGTLEPGVLQIGEPLLEEQFRPSLLSGQVFAGFVGSTTVEAGRIDANEVGPDTPFLLSYTYDYGRGTAELRINGRLIGEARAFAPQAITSRKIIGRHAWMQNFFSGDLAELLIYNKALSPRELSDVTAYLADKYAISLESGGSD